MKAKFGLVLVGVMLSIGSGVARAEGDPPAPAQQNQNGHHGTGVDAAGHVTCPSCAARALAAEKAQRDSEAKMAPSAGKPAAAPVNADSAHQNK